MTQILVIDDEENIREVLLEFLDAEGFQVVTAVSGKSGLQLARDLQPDLIISNIRLFDIDGFEILRTLKQIPETAEIPFIFLSVKATDADIRQGLELGANAYITKPFKLDDLLTTIVAQLSKE